MTMAGGGRGEGERDWHLRLFNGIFTQCTHVHAHTHLHTDTTWRPTSPFCIVVVAASTALALLLFSIVVEPLFIYSLSRLNAARFVAHTQVEESTLLHPA